MNLRDMVGNFVYEYAKEMKGVKLDADKCYELLQVLSGEKEIELGGEQYKFADDYKLDDQYLVIALGSIYSNLDDNQKDDFIDEMLKPSNNLPKAAYDFFKSEKENRKGKSNDNSSSNSGQGDSSSSDTSDNKDDDQDYSDSYDDDEPELGPDGAQADPNAGNNVDEEKLSFDHDGHAIKAYKEETARLKAELAELEGALQNGGVNGQTGDRENPEIEEETNNYTNLFATLKESLETNRRIRTELNQNYGMNLDVKKYDEYEAFLREVLTMNKDDKTLDQQIEETQKEINDLSNNIEAQKRELESLTEQGIKNDTTMMLRKGIYEREKEKRDAESKLADLKYKKVIARKDAKYINPQQIKDIVMQEMQELHETVNAITDKRNELMGAPDYKPENRQHVPYELLAEEDANYGMPGKGTYTSQLNSLWSRLAEQSKAIDNKTRDVNIHPQDHSAVDPEKEALKNRIEELKGTIAEREENEKLYYFILDGIKKLRDAVKEGLDPNGPEATKAVSIIREKMQPLPDSLKDELERYIQMALGKEIVKVDGVTHEPKKTWRTYLAAAAGLGVGTWIGLTVGPAGLIASYAVAGLAKVANGYLLKKAKERRLNGNKIESIEEPSEGLRASINKFKEKAIQHEDVLRDINWGLNGSLIGLTLGGWKKGTIQQIGRKVKEFFVGKEPVPDGVEQIVPEGGEQVIPGISGQQPTAPELHIGDQVNGLEYGYRTSADAAARTNVTHLKQAIMNDGNSVVSGFRVGGETVTSLPAGVTPDAVLISDGATGTSRAWAYLDDVLEAAGKVR